MNPIGQAIEALFARESWKYTKRDDYNYTAGFKAQNNRYDLRFLIGEQRNTLCVYAIVPVQASTDKLSEIAEFVCRANYDMTLGNFELDFRDGEIRFKTSIDFLSRDPDLEDVNRLLDCSLAMADRYYPGFGAVIYGGKTAEEAVKDVEDRS